MLVEVSFTKFINSNHSYISVVKMAFTYQDGLKIKEQVAEKGGTISRRDLANLLSRYTNTMQPWWVKIYMESMVRTKMLTIEPDGTFKVTAEQL